MYSYHPTFLEPMNFNEEHCHGNQVGNEWSLKEHSCLSELIINNISKDSVIRNILIDLLLCHFHQLCNLQTSDGLVLILLPIIIFHLNRSYLLDSMYVTEINEIVMNLVLTRSFMFMLVLKVSVPNHMFNLRCQVIHWAFPIVSKNQLLLGFIRVT